MMGQTLENAEIHEEEKKREEEEVERESPSADKNEDRADAR
jgi:hypothetical protein